MKDYSMAWLLVMISAFVSSMLFSNIFILLASSIWILGVASCLFVQSRQWSQAICNWQREQEYFGDIEGKITWVCIPSDWATTFVSAKNFGCGKDIIITQPYARDVFLLTLTFRHKDRREWRDLAKTVLGSHNIDNKTLRYLFWRECAVSPLLAEAEWNKRIDDYLNTY